VDGSSIMADLQLKRLTWSKGWWQLTLSLYLSNEPGKLTFIFVIAVDKFNWLVALLA